jgi:putative FmdB family regulatory protein
MPTYTYICSGCSSKFELFSSISNYVEHPYCQCGSNNTIRSYEDDMTTISSSIKKSDSELKTIGDLANRNRDRMSDDQKKDLYIKHNSYKEQEPIKELPKGMSRIKKPKEKIQWTKK